MSSQSGNGQFAKLFTVDFEGDRHQVLITKTTQRTGPGLCIETRVHDQSVQATPGWLDQSGTAGPARDRVFDRFNHDDALGFFLLANAGKIPAR